MSLRELASDSFQPVPEKNGIFTAANKRRSLKLKKKKSSFSPMRPAIPRHLSRETPQRMDS